MAILIQQGKGNDGRDREEVGAQSPLHVQITPTADNPLVTVSSKVFVTDLVEVPGIGTAAAYATGDAFGTRFSVPVPVQGTISDVVFLDFDDEGLNKELVLFTRGFTATADNAAFAVSDLDLHFALRPININTWFNYDANQIGIATPALSYIALGGILYGQFVTRGADNIAAGSVPKFYLVIL